MQLQCMSKTQPCINKHVCVKWQHQLKNLQVLDPNQHKNIANWVTKVRYSILECWMYCGHWLLWTVILFQCFCWGHGKFVHAAHGRILFVLAVTFTFTTLENICCSTLRFHCLWNFLYSAAPSSSPAAFKSFPEQRVFQSQSHLLQFVHQFPTHFDHYFQVVQSFSHPECGCECPTLHHATNHAVCSFLIWKGANLLLVS